MRFIGNAIKITNKYSVTLCASDNIKIEIRQTYKPNIYIIIICIYCNYDDYDCICTSYNYNTLNKMEVFLQGQYRDIDISLSRHKNDISIWSLLNPDGKFEGMKISFYYNEDKLGKL